MSLPNSLGISNHELVLFKQDRTSGLKAIIAIHSTALGPALGGCRMLPYQSEEEALADVLKLSKAMSYKAAMAGLPQTGGKAVILGDPHRDKTPELLTEFAEMVNMLNGSYITSIDSGTDVRDMDIISETTNYVAGTGRGSGDPSEATAWGVFNGMKAAIEFRYDIDNFQDIKVAIQGVGHVGEHLCRFLTEAGAELIVADKDEETVKSIAKTYRAQIVSPEEILFVDCNIIAPCALGGVLSEQSIPKLKCDIIAGAANNQLASQENGNTILERNILYLPDYVINAGGIIDLLYERTGDNYEKRIVFTHCAKIHDTVSRILEKAQSSHTATNIVADQMAERLLQGA